MKHKLVSLFIIILLSWFLFANLFSENYFNLSLSPDGKNIAFIGDNILGWKLYVTDIDNLSRISSSKNIRGVVLEKITWSPDSSQIIVEVEINDKNQLYLFSKNQLKQARYLVEGHSPIWVSDSKILFLSKNNSNGQDFYTININGHGKTQLTNNSLWYGSPSLSPKGKEIAITTADREFKNLEICIIDTSDTKNIRKLAKGYSPKWSPDGTKIAFLNERIYFVNNNGSNIMSAATLPKNLWKISELVWSPNGNNILLELTNCVVSNVANSKHDCKNDIYNLSLNNPSVLQHLISGSSPNWLLNGEEIIFIKNSKIYSLDIDSNQLTKLR